MQVQEIHWLAPDFRKAGRRAAWHSFTLFAAFILGIVAFVRRDIPFFIFVLLVEFFILVGTKRSRSLTAKYRVDISGLWVSDELICRPQELAKFDITDHGESQDVVPWCELVLVFRKTRPRFRRILMPHEQGRKVRDFLADQWQTPEFEYQIGPVEFFMRLFGL